MEAIDPIYAYFSVSESDLVRFMKVAEESGHTWEDVKRNPPPLYLGLADEEDFPREGRFDFSERTIDRETGTALRRGVFPNHDESLIPGMFVRIRAPLGSPRPRILVEERAVASDQRGDYLLVVDDKNKVEYRPVRLGRSQHGMRVVEEGVGLEDWVVVNGLQRARPGTTVDPQQAETEVAADDAEKAPAAGADTAAKATPKQAG
jgi:membrane fusion protein (multidrug efflux system)